MSKRTPRLPASPAIWLALLALNLGCRAEPAPPPPTAEVSEVADLLPVRPRVNVLVVSFDALRADALGSYGYARPTSPNIDAFAAKSVLFERAYTAGPITPTSFAGSFSGKLPHRAFHRWRLVAEPTLGEIFSDAGYRTAGLLNNVNLAEARSFDRGFGDYLDVEHRIPDRDLLAKATDWLGRHRAEPFLLWVHFNDPHAPYEAREAAAAFYDPTYRGRFVQSSGGQFETDDPEEVTRLRTLYDGEVLHADSLFGRLMESLADLGLESNTVVVLTADHGEAFLEHGELQHKRLHEPVLHVPLVVHHPDRSEGARIATPVSLLDLLPSLADIAGLDRPDDLDGKSFQRAPDQGRLVLSQAITARDYIAVSAVSGSDKLVLDCLPTRAVRYFRLDEDPGEEHDLAGTETATARTLLSELRDIVGKRPCRVLAGATKGADPKAGLDPEAIRELRALGYLD